MFTGRATVLQIPRPEAAAPLVRPVHDGYSMISLPSRCGSTPCKTS